MSQQRIILMEVLRAVHDLRIEVPTTYAPSLRAAASSDFCIVLVLTQAVKSDNMLGLIQFIGKLKLSPSQPLPLYHPTPTPTMRAVNINIDNDKQK
mmetsp:Transcript_10616/g.15663  ORF Transcript_10616/g.15663 Transcript_10616/m.15663 type:complete len:96 (-) Transcript_10616:74-361(-)